MADETNNVQKSLVTASALSGTINLHSQVLTSETKAKLKGLGVDTNDIKTEEEGQKVLREAEEELEQKKLKLENEEKKRKADENIHYRLKKLAREMGIPINEYDSVSKMIEKTSRKIRELRSQSQQESAISKVNQQKREYQDILNRYLTSQKEEKKLDDNLNTIAYYNKLYQQMKSQ